MHPPLTTGHRGIKLRARGTAERLTAQLTFTMCSTRSSFHTVRLMWALRIGKVNCLT